MAETFRPQRQSIDPSEVSANENQGKLAQMAQMRARVASEDDSDDVTNFRDSPEAGIDIKGNVPAAFQQALRKNAPQQERGPKKRPQELSDSPSNSTGDMKLENLLARIKNQTNVYEEVTLPSRGKFYDGENGPSDGVIHIRPMTGEEEQILATPRFVKRGQAINMIFNRCIEENFDAEKFLSPDRTYLLIYLRGISYTPSYDVEVKCPNCDRKFAHTIDLDDLYLDDCPDDFSEKNLTGRLPTTGLSFSYRLATGEDDQRVQDYRDRKMKGFDTSGQSDDTLLYRSALMINEIEGITDNHQIQQLLKKLPINDVNHLRSVINEPPFGIDTTVSIPCPACTQEFEIELPLEANFFFPKAKKTKETTQA